MTETALRIRDFTKTKDNVALLAHISSSVMSSRAMRTTYGERSSTPFAVVSCAVPRPAGARERGAPAATSLGARAFLASDHCQPQLVHGPIGGKVVHERRRGRGRDDDGPGQARSSVPSRAQHIASAAHCVQIFRRSVTGQCPRTAAGNMNVCGDPYRTS
jgi:hypothetical protein